MTKARNLVGYWMKQHTDKLDGTLFQEVVLSIGNMSDEEFDKVVADEK